MLMRFTTTIFVAAAVAALLSDVSIITSSGSIDFSATVADYSTRAGSEHACWDDRSGQPHCHA